MAIHIHCESCGRMLNIPDDRRGKRVSCPHCGATLIAIDRKEREEIQKVAAVRAMHEDLKHRREEIENRKAELQQQRESAQESLRHFIADTPTRYPSISALSVLLLFLAYLFAILSLGGGLYFSKSEDTTEPVYIILGVAAAVIFFVFFKLLAEIVHIIKDIGDNQQKMVNLLHDLYERESSE